jgi:hypothetical protein
MFSIEGMTDEQIEQLEGYLGFSLKHLKPVGDRTSFDLDNPDPAKWQEFLDEVEKRVEARAEKENE